MKRETKEMLKIINAVNKKKKQWSYLTSIEYMLKSKLYMTSVYSDAKEVARYISKKSIVLDFGTGSGIFAIMLRALNSGAKIYAIDTYYDKSQKDPNFTDASSQQKLIWKKFSEMFKISFFHYNGLIIPFPDSTFDIITAYAVVEHIDPKDLGKIFNELKRVLKKRGLLFIFKLPRKLALTEYLAGFLGLGRHNILYGDLEIKNIFSKNQFDVLKTWKSNIVPEFPGKITNLFYPIFLVVNFILLHSPFRIFAHHNNFILRKVLVEK